MDLNRAILVIDMLNDFLYGKLPCEPCRNIIGDVKKLIEFGRDVGIPVIYLCDSHLENDREFKKWPPHAVEGTEGAEVIEELKPGENDFIVRKRRYSGFFQTGLDEVLKKLKIKGLVLAGILTNICVQHTAADAFFRDYELIIPKECTEAISGEVKKDSLTYMGEIYGAKIVSLNELLQQ